jgi:hypothetical protein
MQKYFNRGCRDIVFISREKLEDEGRIFWTQAKSVLKQIGDIIRVS